MVKKQLTQKEQDLQFIEKKLKYIEKHGGDTSKIPVLNKRHGQAKIHDLRLHLEKNTNYQYTKLKSLDGEVMTTVSKATLTKAKSNAKNYLQETGFVKNGFVHEGKKKVQLYTYNGAQMTVNQLANYIVAYDKAKSMMGKEEEKIKTYKEVYQIFAEELGMSDPIKNTNGDGAKVSFTSIKKLKGEKGRELLDHETKEMFKFDLTERYNEMYGDILENIASVWGYDNDIFERISHMSYTDLEILRSMFRNDNEFYASMYGSDGQGDRGEEVKQAQADKLSQKIDELDKLRNAKDEYLRKADMTLGGKN